MGKAFRPSGMNIIKLSELNLLTEQPQLKCSKTVKEIPSMMKVNNENINIPHYSHNTPDVSYHILTHRR